MTELLGILFSIIVINIVLGGDNAVVIAMASRTLPPAERRKAVLWGSAGAIVLRIVFAAVATFLLGIPYLMVIGGALLTWIAYKLLADEEQHDVTASDSIGEAVRTIVIADAVMSLDNSLAIAVAAEGHIWMLVFGLALSVPIIIWCSQIIANIMNKYGIIVYIGAGILAWTAGELFVEDPIVHHLIPAVHSWLGGLVAVGVVLAAGYLARQRRLNAARTASGEDGEGAVE